MSIKIDWIIPASHNDYNQMPASVWIRCLQLLPYLNINGIQSETNKLGTDARIVVFVRNQNLESLSLAKRFKAEGKKIIFDLCVNYFDSSNLSNLGSPVDDRQIEECLRMVEVADCVTCASDNIAGRAKDFHERVEYIPDSFDFNYFKYKKDPTDFHAPRLKAIWSGEAIKALELTPILKLLKRKKIPLKLITNKPIKLYTGFSLISYKYEFIKWQYATFPSEIIGGEICLNYREVDTPYNRGHSFFKIGAFLAEGVPCLVSPVPSYLELLDDGACGRVCKDINEWEENLDMLMDDRNILKSWSESAVARMRSYSTERIALRYVDLFSSLTNV